MDYSQDGYFQHFLLGFLHPGLAFVIKPCQNYAEKKQKISLILGQHVAHYVQNYILFAFQTLLMALKEGSSGVGKTQQTSNQAPSVVKF